MVNEIGPKRWMGNQGAAAVVADSVGNESGLSHRVQVQVQNEPLPNWQSGMATNQNCQLGYVSMVNSKPL